ncbi:hypothetical protein C0J52_24587, partial [Blattella germanica]
APPSTSYPFSCPAGKVPNCPFPDPALSVFFPHENDSRWFYHCSNGVAYCKVCPFGLHWNANLDTCDWPEHVRCRSVLTSLRNRIHQLSLIRNQLHVRSRGQQNVLLEISPNVHLRSRVTYRSSHMKMTVNRISIVKMMETQCVCIALQVFIGIKIYSHAIGLTTPTAMLIFSLPVNIRIIYV